MKLLISAINAEEAKRCIKGGADIVDVKNPQEGSLGGHSPRVIRKIRSIVPRSLELSAAIGDIGNKPGLVSQAALGLAMCDVEYLKMGLCEAFTVKNAVSLVKEVVNTIHDTGKRINIVVCGYADAKIKNIIRPEYIPDIVYKGGADVAMIDTLVKGTGKRLFDYLDEREISLFSSKAHTYGLKVALAGSLRKEDILRIRDMGCCDIIGIRTLACRNEDRGDAIQTSRVRAIKRLL